LFSFRSWGVYLFFDDGVDVAAGVEVGQTCPTDWKVMHQ
jgi:hypothetical protein